MKEKPTFYNTKQAAEYLGLKECTLEKWRWAGTGPKFVKLNGAVRYLDSALRAFTEERTFQSTSEIR